MSTDAQFGRQREDMVEQQLRRRGIHDARVLAAMRAVRREGYVPGWLGERAYEDAPLPIEEEQTISQPYIVAFMTQEHGFDRTCVVGFGTHDGVVACASHWGGPLERKAVRPSRADSYERVCHDAGVPNFLLPLRHAPGPLHAALTPARLLRALGVVYRPETERASHYQSAVLPRQFDEYVWFDRTSAVTPLDSKQLAGAPDTYPCGL